MKNKKITATSVIIATILVNLCVGILYMWSVYQNGVTDLVANGELRDKAFAAVKLTSSFSMMAFVIGSFGGGYVQDHTSPRLTGYIGAALFSVGIFICSWAKAGVSVWWFYCFYGMMGGLGTGFVYATTLSCIQKWLPHRIGMASGISIASFGLSVIAFSPIANAMIANPNIGLLKTMRILSVIFFVVLMVVCAFLRNPPREYLDNLNLPAAKATLSQRQYTTKETLCDIRVWMLWFAMFTGTALYNILMPVFKPLAELRGVGENVSVLSVMVMGAGSSIARFVTPTIADKIKQSTMVIYLGVLNIIAAILMIFAKGSFYIVAVFIVAFAFGGPASCLASLCTKIFGTRYSAANYGIVMLSLGTSSIVFNLVANSFNGNYTAIFIVAAVVGVGMPLMMVLLQPIHKRRMERDKKMMAELAAKK